MESVYPELARCGSKNLRSRTDSIFYCLSEVSNDTVFLMVLPEIFYSEIKEKSKGLVGSIFAELFEFSDV